MPRPSSSSAAKQTVTADSITDAQIRELEAVARANGYDADHAVASICWVALYDIHSVGADERRAKARARCAAILNARLQEVA